MSRPATPDDVDAICASLPETELGTSWGDVPTWKVPRGDKGKGFLLYRPPHRSAVDPETGEAALVEDPGTPFFTIDHFRRSTAVLVQQSRLDELDVDELREVLTDAWAVKAPKRLAAAYLADPAVDG